MRPWMAGLVQLGLAGSCLFWTGCGGSDVPDPDSDSQAASDVAPKGSGAPAAAPEESAASEQAPAAAPVAAAEPSSAPSPAAVASDPRLARIQGASLAGGSSESEAAPITETAAAAPAAESAPTEAPSEPANTESSAATNEMLALASSTPAAPDANADATGGAKPPGANGPPGSGPGANFPGQGPGQGRMQPPANYPGMPASGDPDGAVGGNKGALAAAGGRNGPGMGMAGMPGMGGPGGSARRGSNAPASFLSPSEGVNSFLNALADKDLDRLAEATAKHAPVDAREKNRKLFSEILDGSLSPEDLDDLARKFEGYQMVSADPPRSTGQTVINLEKQEEDGALFGRKVTARKEKAGWKVQDFGGEIDFYETRKYTRKPR